MHDKIRNLLALAAMLCAAQANAQATFSDDELEHVAATLLHHTSSLNRDMCRPSAVAAELDSAYERFAADNANYRSALAMPAPRPAVAAAAAAEIADADEARRAFPVDYGGPQLDAMCRKLVEGLQSLSFDARVKLLGRRLAREAERAAAPTQDAAAIAARLHQLALLFRTPAPALDPALVPKPGDDCAVELAAVAALYRHDPAAWRNRFFALLVIDDYQARASKQYNLIDAEDVAAAIDGPLASNPGVTDERMRLVVGFCELRRTQPFVMTRKAGMVSLARAIRGMMLAELLEGTDEDTLDMANAIDARTRSLHPGVDLSHEEPLE
jgi:hypothetical protein